MVQDETVVTKEEASATEEVEAVVDAQESATLEVIIPATLIERLQTAVSSLTSAMQVKKQAATGVSDAQGNVDVARNQLVSAESSKQDAVADEVEAKSVVANSADIMISVAQDIKDSVV